MLPSHKPRQSFLIVVLVPCKVKFVSNFSKIRISKQRRRFMWIIIFMKIKLSLNTKIIGYLDNNQTLWKRVFCLYETKDKVLSRRFENILSLLGNAIYHWRNLIWLLRGELSSQLHLIYKLENVFMVISFISNSL